MAVAEAVDRGASTSCCQNSAKIINVNNKRKEEAAQEAAAKKAAAEQAKSDKAAAMKCNTHEHLNSDIMRKTRS